MGEPIPSTVQQFPMEEPILSSYDPQFPIVKYLGEGGYGAASLIKHPRWGMVAFKKLSMTTNVDRVEQLKKEARLQKQLLHPNVVTLYDSYVSSNTCGLFLEYMEYGAVDEFIENFEVSWHWKVRILHDVSVAMCYLHEQQPPIIHGDLKTQNILIGNGFRAKISDFGLAHKMKISECEASHPISGTTEYIAPEYLSDPCRNKTESYDAYGFAISAWEILSEKRAYYDFCDRKLIAVKVQEGSRPLMSDIDENISKSIHDMIENCWHQSFKERPAFERVAIILDEIQMHSKPDDLIGAFTNLTEQAQRQNNISIPANVCTTDIPLWRELISSTGIENCITRFQKVRNSLVRYLDPDNGLLLCLNDKNILTDADLEKLDLFRSTEARSFIERNEELLRKYISPIINICCTEFLDALTENDQGHIALHIIHGGRNFDDEERLLTKDEISLINDNMFCLVNLMNPYRMDFLYRLVTKKCITDRHKTTIEKWPDNKKKIDELLTILKRRSYRDFCNFKLCLHDTMQNRIVQILEQGGVITVRVKLEKIADRKIIESKLIDLVSGYVDESTEIDRNLTSEQISIIKDILKDLEASDIRLIGNSAWKSIAVFFQCSTEASVKTFLSLYENGILKDTLERMFRCLLDLPKAASRLIRIVSIIKYQPHDLFSWWTSPFGFFSPILSRSTRAGGHYPYCLEYPNRFYQISPIEFQSNPDSDNRLRRVSSLEYLPPPSIPGSVNRWPRNTSLESLTSRSIPDSDIRFPCGLDSDDEPFTICRPPQRNDSDGSDAGG